MPFVTTSCTTAPVDAWRRLILARVRNAAPAPAACPIGSMARAPYAVSQPNHHG